MIACRAFSRHLAVSRALAISAIRRRGRGLFAPACVNLMHADGSSQRLLWCAPGTIDTIRWAGNGKRLRTFVQYVPNGGYYEHAAVYWIDGLSSDKTLGHRAGACCRRGDTQWCGDCLLPRAAGQDP